MGPAISLTLTVLFWLGMAGLVYAYLGYPLLLALLARVRGEAAGPPAPPAVPPTVSLLIPAHNERANIDAKMANVAALRYPAGALEVIVISDGSTDGTTEYVREAAEPRTTVLEVQSRGGKAGALNAALGVATGEILVFSDASIVLEPDAIERLVAPFADPAIGCVSGEDRIADGGGEGLYGRYELSVRRLESRLGSIVGASGSFYGMRRTLCDPFPAGLAPDFWSVLRCVEQGFRAVTEPTAVGAMLPLARIEDEFHRKVRTLLRGLTTLMIHRHLLNPLRHGFFAFELLSHKLARWLVPLFLLVTLLTSAALAPRSTFFAIAFGIQAALYVLAALAHLGLPPFPGLRLARVALYFVAVNLATLVAWIRYAGGVRQEIWSPSKR
jgi:cellulose synthase/poly-beta-1,6-N-acetylglucosamine synthase-like glycosyltransferase